MGHTGYKKNARETAMPFRQGPDRGFCLQIERFHTGCFCVVNSLT